MGFLCTDIPTDFGGAGGDFRHEVVLYEETSRRGISGFGKTRVANEIMKELISRAL
jgi:acyl-CoA dehydrogenase